MSCGLCSLLEGLFGVHEDADRGKGVICSEYKAWCYAAKNLIEHLSIADHNPDGSGCHVGSWC